MSQRNKGKMTAFLGEMSSAYLNVNRLFKQLQEQKSAQMANFPVNSVRQPRNTTPNIHVDNHNWNYSPQPCHSTSPAPAISI